PFRHLFSSRCKLCTYHSLSKLTWVVEANGLVIGALIRAHSKRVLFPIRSPKSPASFAGALRKGVFNVFRRTTAQIPYIAPGILLFYFTVKLGNSRHAYINSKAGAHLREA
ncbi:hypothetical protein BDF22DRAFT_2827, partial [Syncephalis plumigaleata]